MIFFAVFDVAADCSEAMLLRENRILLSTVMPYYKNVPTIFCIKLMSTESNIGVLSAGSAYCTFCSGLMLGRKF